MIDKKLFGEKLSKLLTTWRREESLLDNEFMNAFYDQLHELGIDSNQKFIRAVAKVITSPYYVAPEAFAAALTGDDAGIEELCLHEFNEACRASQGPQGRSWDEVSGRISEQAIATFKEMGYSLDFLGSVPQKDLRYIQKAAFLPIYRSQVVKAGGINEIEIKSKVLGPSQDAILELPIAASVNVNWDGKIDLKGAKTYGQMTASERQAHMVAAFDLVADEKRDQLRLEAIEAYPQATGNEIDLIVSRQMDNLALTKIRSIAKRRQPKEVVHLFVSNYS